MSFVHLCVPGGETEEHRHRVESRRGDRASSSTAPCQKSQQLGFVGVAVLVARRPWLALVVDAGWWGVLVWLDVAEAPPFWLILPLSVLGTSGKFAGYAVHALTASHRAHDENKGFVRGTGTERALQEIAHLCRSGYSSVPPAVSLWSTSTSYTNREHHSLARRDRGC